MPTCTSSSAPPTRPTTRSCSLSYSWLQCSRCDHSDCLGGRREHYQSPHPHSAANRPWRVDRLSRGRAVGCRQLHARPDSDQGPVARYRGREPHLPFQLWRDDLSPPPGGFPPGRLHPGPPPPPPRPPHPTPVLPPP